MKTKVKISLTLSREVVKGIDRVAGKKRSRSAVVDDVLRGYLSHRERAAANARDAEKIETRNPETRGNPGETRETPGNPGTGTMFTGFSEKRCTAAF